MNKLNGFQLTMITLLCPLLSAGIGAMIGTHLADSKYIVQQDKLQRADVAFNSIFLRSNLLWAESRDERSMTPADIQRNKKLCDETKNLLAEMSKIH